MLYINFFVKVSELIGVIFGMAYLCGIIWMIQCELYEDFYYETIYREIPNDEDKPVTFITYFNLDSKEPLEGCLILTYFALTSLTTIGFGDIVPKNSIERIMCSFMLLFGVAIFSYVMNNFLDLVKEYKFYVGEFDEGDELNKFFGTMKKFNNN